MHARPLEPGDGGGGGALSGVSAALRVPGVQPNPALPRRCDRFHFIVAMIVTLTITRFVPLTAVGFP